MKRNSFYHVYNRGNNKESIFFSRRNYIHFLRLFDKYLYDYVELYCYCLMPNHFHFFIRVKELNHLEENELGRQLSLCFRYFFMSYSKAINKEQKRTGSLFQKGFKYVLVDNEEYFTSLVTYIHLNPVKANLVDNCGDWEFSSYNDILSLAPTSLARNQVLNWFNGFNGFIKFHDECKELLNE